MDEKNGIVDVHVAEYVYPITPHELISELPRTDRAIKTVRRGRKSIEAILRGEDPRIFVIAGQCSVHDAEEDKEVSIRLQELAGTVSDKIVIVKRAYFEKPRTAFGWEGLLIDPDINGKDDVNKGYRLSRQILLYSNELGMPCATEYLESSTPQYNDDLVAWAAIGARTAASPQHRKLASILSMPVGIKNDTHGDISVAVNGVRVAMKSGYLVPGVSEDGRHAFVRGKGNPYAHIVLRGGQTGSNYDAESVRQAKDLLENEGLPPNIVIDCSHGNSNKDYTKQPEVFESMVKQIKDGNKWIVGGMIEANIVEGNQKIPTNLTGFDRSTLRYGQSITDACISLNTYRKLILDAYKTLS